MQQFCVQWWSPVTWANGDESEENSQRSVTTTGSTKSSVSKFIPTNVHACEGDALMITKLLASVPDIQGHWKEKDGQKKTNGENENKFHTGIHFFLLFATYIINRGKSHRQIVDSFTANSKHLMRKESIIVTRKKKQFAAEVSVSFSLLADHRRSLAVSSWCQLLARLRNN